MRESGQKGLILRNYSPHLTQKRNYQLRWKPDTQ
ncbi:Integrase [Edwardsiella anguillarum]|nr:Integrase [Edwardsiella anguillarum]BET83619.1 Integrase [Edwardsiella anguillarum]BET86986.1 Integrase [Edwardsiella anguillarum]BET90412.1 Integrase [Edwardsiella anguillarum]